MILVLLGTQNNSFKRLLEQIDLLIKNKIIQDEVVVQAGYTKHTSSNMKILDFISNEELEKWQEKADLIITHGGVGSILSSITKGKKVIAVARQHQYGEHINDHQKDIIEFFSKKDYIIGIYDVQDLEKAIIQSKNFEPKTYQQNNEKMLKIIEDFIENC